MLMPSVAGLELPVGVQRMFADQQQIALNLSMLAAFLAGIISITSPCGFALLPTFFAVAFKDRQRSLVMTSIFSAGLVASFTLFGVIAGVVGNFFNPYKTFFAVTSGVILVLFGIVTFLNKEISLPRFSVRQPKPSTGGSMALVGFLFGIGWTPCVGAVLGGVLLLAANASTLAWSVALLLLYGAGVVAPLLVLSLLADRYNVSRWIQGKAVTFSIANRQVSTHFYNLIGGFILVLMGSIMIAYEGTTFFQIYLPQWTGWGMEWWGAGNTWLANSASVRSGFTTTIGIAVLLMGIIGGYVHIRKKI